MKNIYFFAFVIFFGFCLDLSFAQELNSCVTNSTHWRESRETCLVEYQACTANVTDPATSSQGYCTCYTNYGICLSKQDPPCLVWSGKSGKAYRTACLEAGCLGEWCNSSSILSSNILLSIFVSVVLWII